jgi:hypothetical protein
MKVFFDEHLSLLKAIFFILFGVVALFVDLQGSVKYWSWFALLILSISLIVLEIYHHHLSKASPLAKLTKYLSDLNGWEKAGAGDYYISDPDFTLSPLEDEASLLAYQDEWTRGEIGYHYESGNSAYYIGAFKGGLLLNKIHVVIFDGGKKKVVAPDWEAVGRGRFYFYLSDSIKYAYQLYLSHGRGVNHSCGIRRASQGYFDIPVLKDTKELERFLAYCGEEQYEPSSNVGEQNEIFYGLLEKYNEFKEKGSHG